MKNLIVLVCIGAILNVNAQKRDIEVGNFNEVYFGLPGTLYLTQGNENSLTIEASDDAWEMIEVDEDGDKLKIKQKNYKNWKSWNNAKITVYVTMKSIEGVGVGGSGDIVGKGKINADDMDVSVSGSGSVELDLRAEDMDVSISGSGKVYLEGQADEVELSISGSGKMKGEDLEVNVLDASISGSGSAYITANKEIDARISGSGSVYYNGNPDRVSSRASGSGKVRKM